MRLIPVNVAAGLARAVVLGFARKQQARPTTHQNLCLRCVPRFVPDECHLADLRVCLEQRTPLHARKFFDELTSRPVPQRRPATNAQISQHPQLTRRALARLNRSANKEPRPVVRVHRVEDFPHHRTLDYLGQLCAVV